jgi:hypothetical protein
LKPSWRSPEKTIAFLNFEKFTGCFPIDSGPLLT